MTKSIPAGAKITDIVVEIPSDGVRHVVIHYEHDMQVGAFFIGITMPAEPRTMALLLKALLHRVTGDTYVPFCGEAEEALLRLLVRDGEVAG